MDDSFESVSVQQCTYICLPTQTPVSFCIESVRLVRFENGFGSFFGYVDAALDLDRLCFEHTAYADFLAFCKANCGVHRVGTLHCSCECDFMHYADIFLVPARFAVDHVDPRCDYNSTLAVYRGNAQALTEWRL